jgi:hypothetical protein
MADADFEKTGRRRFGLQQHRFSYMTRRDEG